MKTESNVHYIARLTITLLLITAVVAALLAAVNSVTAPRIAAQNEEKTQAAVEAVLPGGGQQVDYTDDTGLVGKVYKGDAGYAVEVMPSGFNGTVTMMVGVGTDGKVLGISIVNHTETAGLGAVGGGSDHRGQRLPRPVRRHERQCVREEGRRSGGRSDRCDHHLPGGVLRRERRAERGCRFGLRRYVLWILRNNSKRDC